MRGECPSCVPPFLCCFSTSIESVPSVPLPQVPNAGHRTALSGSSTRRSEPWSPLLLFPVVLLHLPSFAPRAHSSVTGFRILWVCSPFSLWSLQSLFLSPKSATLSSSCSSVSHTGVEVFCTVKRPTSGSECRVVRCVPANPVCALGPVAQVGVVAAVIRPMVSVACRDQLDILSP